MDGSARWLLVMLLIGWAPVCFSSHFRGAIITWKPGNRDKNEIIIDFRISWRMSYTELGTNFHCDADTISSGTLIGNGEQLSCFTNCLGNLGSVNYRCTDFSNTEDWSSGRGTVVFQAPRAHNYYEFGYHGNAWIPLNSGGSGAWNLKVSANLTLRSDKTINSSPVVEIPPVVRLQKGCNHTIVLPVSDPDGDIVRCRWASSRNDECGSICSGFPHSYITSETCEITYDAKYNTGWYGVAVQVEDFVTQNSTQPLSSVPVQFLVYVFNSADTTCNQTTKFVSPTPPDNACIGVPIDSIFEATVAAQVANTNRSITQIQTISPVGMSKSDISMTSDTIWQMNITWNPQASGTTQNQFCFTAEDSAQSRSEKRCISLLAGVNPPEFDNTTSDIWSEVPPTQRDWTIQANMEITQTHRNAYIRVFHALNDTEVESIDASDTMKVSIQSPRHGLHFSTTVDFIEKEVYYILFDFGVVRSRTYCLVESKEVTDKYFWRFKTRDITPPQMIKKDIPFLTNATSHLSWLYDEPVVTVCQLEDPNEHLSTVQCNNSWTGTHLLFGLYRLMVQATDLAGNKGVMKILPWFVDGIPPVVTLTSHPLKLSNEERVEFRWDSSKTSSFRCRLLPQDWADCRQPHAISILQSASGTEQSFEVQATDYIGNVGNIVTYNWTTDFEAPTIKLCGSGIKMNVSCEQDLRPENLCAALVSDSVDHHPTLTFSDTPTSSPNCGIVRTWTAQDAAGNIATVSQNIHVTVDKPLHLVKAPGQISVACGTLHESELKNVLKDTFEVTHPCGLPLTYSYRDTPATEECDILVTRTWTISDGCGTNIQISQPIRVMHVRKPLSPENGQVDTDLSLYLRWPSSGAQTKYDVYLWERNVARPRQSETVTNYTFYAPSHLKPDTQYLWQVVFSFSGNDTFVGPVWGFQTRKFADLVVKSVTVPSMGFSGQTYEIQWTVMNIGKLQAQSYWYDAVYLSFTDKFSEAKLQSTVYQHNIILPNDGYSSKAPVKFGNDQIGTAYFFIKTNIYNYVEELNTTNNLMMRSMEVKLTPPPDLIVSSVIIPKSSYSGQTISVRWTVVNKGQGATVTGGWWDRIWLSTDNVTDYTDVDLGYAARSGDLAPGEKYTVSRSVNVPEFITGDFYVLVETDSTNQVFEFNSDGNNVVYSQSPIHIILTPPPDLEVTSVTVPESVTTGDVLTVSWEVTNTGNLVPSSQIYWRDKVEMASTSTHRIKTLQYTGHYGALGSSASYKASESFPVTADLQTGAYIVTVTTNYDHRVFEYTKTENNEKRSNKFVITKALPNLHIYNFTIEDVVSHKAGMLQAAWSVQNIGQAKTLSQDWIDTLRLTFPHLYGNTILLQSTAEDVTGIAPGETYEINKTFNLPPEIYGHVEISLTVDDMYESTGDEDRSDNVASDYVYIPLIAPDLEILDNVSISEDIVGGKPLRVMYTVQNVGNKELTNMTWFDEVMIMTNDGSYNCRDSCKLNNVHEISENLHLNSSYTIISHFTLPEAMSGDYTVSIMLDIHSDVFEGPNKDNNKKTMEIQVKAAPKPDLTVSNVHSTLSGEVGKDKLLNIEWTVKNTGNSMKSFKAWIDSVALKRNESLHHLTILDSFNIFHKLEASIEYSMNKTIIVPYYIVGDVQFCIYTDSSSQLEEAFSKQDNLLCDETHPHIKEPLQAKLQATVTHVKAVKAGYIAPGANLYISFKVENTGDLATEESSWIDSVYIINTAASSVEQLKAVGKSVAEITHVGKLDAKQLYNLTQIITIPSTFSGNVMLYVLPNNSYEAEYASIAGGMPSGSSSFPSGEHTQATAVAANFTTAILVPGLLPNMFIQVNTTSAEYTGGQPVLIEYEVTNNGSAPISRYWYDAVYISDDYILDVFDQKLKSVHRTENIEVNETVSQNITFLLPMDMETKSYFLIFKCDSRDDIFEENEEDNEARMVVQMQQRTSTDLYVTNVIAPGAASYGKIMNVEWTVMNNGSKTASGYKCDTAYLSEDKSWDITDTLVGQPQCTAFTLRSNTLSVHSQVTARTPSVAAGSYNTLIKSRSNILDVNLDNNVAVAKNKTEVIITSLSLGTSENWTLHYNDLMLFHVPDVPLDNTLIINVSSDCTHCFSVFTKGGSPAKLYDFEQTSTNLNLKYTVTTIPNTNKADYYILIQTTYSQVFLNNMTISANIAKFEILEVFPSSLMKGVDVTLRIQGTLFPDNVIASLENNVTSERSEAVRTVSYSSTEIYATFNIPLDSVITKGTLQLLSPSTNKTTVFSRTIHITTGVKGYLTTSMSPLGRLRNNEQGFISLTIQNNGDSDMLVPLILIQARGEGDIKYIDKNMQHAYKQEYFLLGSSESGPAGILPPKAYRRFYFEARQNINIVRGSANMEVTVSTISADKNVPNPFLNQKQLLRPSHYDASAWEPVWNNFIAMTGNSTHSLISKISKVLNEMSIVNHHVWMVDDMIRYLLDMADSPMGDKMDVVEVDVAMETDLTVGLTISRHLSSRIGYRSQIGPMGKGWILPLWDTKIKTVLADLVVVTLAKKDVVFVKMEDGLFWNLRAGKIRLSEDEYVLTRLNDQQRYHFDDTSLKLKSVVSLVDVSRIDLEYTDDKLTRIKHSRGSYITISYDSLGRIASTKVHNTSVSLMIQESQNLYEYAMEENVLKSAVVGGKRTRYNYNSDSSIRFITHSDNSMYVYEYSRQRFLTAKRFVVRNAQVSGAEYQYHDNGMVTVTTLPGNFVNNITFDEDGEIILVRRDKYLPVKTVKTRSLTTDFEGNYVLTRKQYNSEERSITVEDGNCDSIGLVYDEIGLLQKFLDGGKNEYKFSYDNITGNLNQVIYPDGSNITYSYSGHKQFIRNQNGEVKTLEFNEKNQLITRTTGNDHITSFEYDNGGRLVQAISNDDTVKLTYEGSDVVEVAYSDASIHYEHYPDGKLQKLYTDQDYAVEYVYNDDGKVKQVIDRTTNNTLVQVSYSETGRIKNKLFGNNASTVYYYDKDTDLLQELRNYYANGSVATFFKYTYSPRQRRIALETNEGVWKFEYDTAGQVTMMTSPNGTVTRFLYDNRKNRKTVEVNGSQEYATVNSMNQYETYGSVNFVYDRNGNMVQKKGPKSSAYSFDADNRLVEMQTGSHNCSFKYDSLGNLKAKVCNGVHTRYLTDPIGYMGSTIIEQITGMGDKMQLFYGGEQVGLIGLKDKNGINYFQYDPVGSVVGILDQNGDLLNWYQSDPFGQVLQSHESIDSPFIFVGQWGVLRIKESSSLYFMRARVYDSATGRFLSLDPDGISARSKNFYAYCSNNPVQCKDPEGRWWWVVAKGVWGGAKEGFKYWYTHRDDGSFSWGGFAGATIEGTLDGLVSSLPVPEAVKTLIKGVDHVIGTYVHHLIDHEKYSVKQALKDYGNYELKALEDWGLNKYFGDNLPKSLQKIGKGCGYLEFWARISLPICHPLDALRNLANKAAKEIYQWGLSHDPNDIIGPKGYGAARFIKGDATLTYKIRFENDENATAPAQRVYVQHAYSQHLDPRSFVMGSFGFGDIVQEVLEGSKLFQGSINMTSEFGIFVSVVAGLDISSQQITWEFQSLDPETGEAPTNASTGFLPPNNGTSGQGFVSFTMKPAASSLHLAVINTNASIYFDENEPIDTPNIFNTIDKKSPVANGSVVQQLLTSGTAAVQLSTHDSGSGVKHVDLFLKQDESMVLLQGGITDNVVTLPLQPGANYTLVPIATDHVGNQQIMEMVTENYWIWLVFLNYESSCNCSDHGNCSVGTTVCQCEEGFYGETCDSDVPPHEPPILDIRATVGLQGKPVTLYLSALNQSGSVDHMTLTITGFPHETVFSSGYQKDQTGLVLDSSDFGPVNMTVPDSFYGNLMLHVEVNETSAAKSVTRTGDLSVTIVPDISGVVIDIHGCFFTENQQTAVRLNVTVSDWTSNVSIPFSVALSLPPWASVEGKEQLGGSSYLLQNTDAQYIIQTHSHFQPFNVTVNVSLPTAGYEALSEAMSWLEEINTTCTACPVNTYGLDCGGTCDCNLTSTLACDKFDGSCLCMPGYTGPRCGDDVDECALNTSLCEGSARPQCYNIPGGYSCVCKDGFWEDGDNCTECQGLYYGFNCSSPCPCNSTNTDSCDNKDGHCQCSEGWTGAHCDVDVDECSANMTTCETLNHTVCQNTAGGYDCLCRRGFQEENDTCTEIPKTVKPTIVSPTNGAEKMTSIEVKFNINIPITDNLDAADTYDRYEEEAREVLNSYYRTMLGIGFIRVVIVDLWRGSLYVKHEVVTRDHAFVLQELGYAVNELSQEPNMTFFGQTVSVEDVKVGDVPVRGNKNATGQPDDPCKSFTAITPCGQKEKCVLEHGLPTCRSDQVVITKTESKDEDTGKRDRIILMSIFIPVGTLMLIFLVCAAGSYLKRKEKKDANDSQPGDIELKSTLDRNEGSSHRSSHNLETASNPTYRDSEPVQRASSHASIASSANRAQPGTSTSNQGPPGAYTSNQGPPGAYTSNQGPPGAYTANQEPPRAAARVEAKGQRVEAGGQRVQYGGQHEERLGAQEEPMADYDTTGALHRDENMYTKTTRPGNMGDREGQRYAGGRRDPGARDGNWVMRDQMASHSQGYPRGQDNRSYVN